jgi:pilus assembly protein CpaB
MNPDKKRLLFAAALAALAFALALGWLSLEERRLLQRGETVKVLVAKRYLPAYARLEAKDLAWLSLPRAYAPIGAVGDASAVLGLQTLVPFNAEEPLIFNKLALGEQSLAAAVPEGKRAVSLPVNAVSGVSGLLKPGDHVDVLLLHGQGAQASAALLLQDVAVLAVGSQLTRGDAPAATGGTVTLALSPGDAALALASLSGGELHLTLRAAGDSRPAPVTKAGFGDALRRTERAAPMALEPSPGSGAVDDLIPRKR